MKEIEVVVTLRAVLEPNVSEAQGAVIAQKLEDYAHDAVKYVDGVDSIKMHTEVWLPPNTTSLSADEALPGISTP